MDNKAYLDEIAVKGKKKFSAGPILTPVMIKLIIVGVAAVISLIVVATMLGSRNDGSAALHEAVYLRINSLMDKKGPVQSYIKKVKDTNLRTWTTQLISSLTPAQTSIKAVSKKIGLNTSGSDADVKAENTKQMNTFKSDLERAYLSGRLDTIYATDMSYQLTLLINLENQARVRTSDATYAKALDDSIRDLTTLEESFRDYSDNH